MLAGPVSRSAGTAKVHRLMRDGYATEADFLAAVGKDSREIEKAQKNFAFVSTGQLDWLDAFRPLTRCFGGFAVRDSAGEDAVGPVTRWFRTDTFYRKPLVNDKIECGRDELAGFMPGSPSDSVIFLPAPYTFANLVENSYYDTLETLALDYARAVSKSAVKLGEKGYKCILLTEPFVGYAQSKGNNDLPDWFSRSLSEIRAPGIKVGVNFPLAEIEIIMPHVDGSDVDFVGIDTTFSSGFKIDTGKDVFIGVVDGARPLVEDNKDIKKRIDEFLSKASFSGKYYIGPNDRLWDVPFEVGLKKIGALAEFKPRGGR